SAGHRGMPRAGAGPAHPGGGDGRRRGAGRRAPRRLRARGAGGGTERTAGGAMPAAATEGGPAAGSGRPATARTGRRPLVRGEGLVKHYPIRRGLFRKADQHIHAVDDISFEIGRGESLGLVGESGCGKTTTGRLLTRLTDPTAGRMLLDVGDEGVVDIAHLEGPELKRFRRQVQMIFQDPY